jgi:Sucrase/ferredoxin-like
VTSFPRELCSDVDLAVGDDPHGSAARFDSFVVVEQRGSFGREAGVDALRAVDPVRADALLAVPGLRPFAIRPVGRAETSGVRTRFAGRTGPDAWLAPIDELPADAPSDRPSGSAWEPLFAVCTNGSRDRCCALKSRDLAVLMHRELDDPDAGEDATVVEVSHLGGHRFAPTMLVLPTGYAYGRLDLDTALEIAWAAQDGLVHPANLRGRADLEPAAQAADAHWRGEIGTPQPVDAVRITTVTTAAAHTRVEADVQGRTEHLAMHWQSGVVVESTLCGPKPIATGRWVAS